MELNEFKEHVRHRRILDTREIYEFMDRMRMRLIMTRRKCVPSFRSFSGMKSLPL